MSTKNTKKNNKYAIVHGWAKQLNTDANVIIAEIKLIESEILDEHNDMDDDEVLNTAIGRYFAAQKKHLTDIGGEKVIYFIFQNTGPLDWVLNKRTVALNHYELDASKAIKEGYVRVIYNDLDEVTDVIPLFYWKLNREGKPNKKYGEDLPEHSYMYSVSGIGILKSDFDKGEIGNNIMKLNIAISNEQANIKSNKFLNTELFGKWGITELRIKSSDNGILDCESNASTTFNKPFEFPNMNKKSILQLYNNQIITLDKIQSTFIENINWKNPHAKGTNATFVSTVYVSAINMGNENVSASVAVSSPEMGIIDADGKEIRPYKIWWNDYIPLDFGEGSKLAIWYKLKQNELKVNKKFTGKWGQISLMIQGCLVLNKVEVKIEELKPEIETETEESNAIEINIDNELDELTDEELEKMESEINLESENIKTEETVKTEENVEIDESENKEIDEAEDIISDLVEDNNDDDEFEIDFGL